MPVYLHELVRTVGARTDQYLDSVAEHQGRSAERAGRRATLIGVFRALEVSGEAPLGVNLWRWGEWTEAAAILGGQFEPSAQDPELKKWWLGNIGLRSGGFDRLLESAVFSPDTAALRAARPPALFLHEIVEVDPAGRAAYLDLLGDVGTKALSSVGGALVGAYRSVLRDDEAVSLAGFPSAASLAAFAAAWHARAANQASCWRERATPLVRARRTLVLRARHWLKSPWHA